MLTPNSNQPVSGLWRDSIKSQQPKGTWRYALNAQTETFDANSFGLVNEPSNELHVDLGEGWIIISGGFIEDLDKFLFFARKNDENRSTIGLISTKEKKTTILVDDKDWDDKLCFDKCEYIPVEFKKLQPCNHTIAYFSAGHWYYRLDLNADLCNITRDDIFLLKCPCPPKVEATVVDGGGSLVGGVYQFVVQLMDSDNNVTNWFQISNPSYVTADNNKAGDISNQSIDIFVDGIDNKDWNLINIGVVKTIDNQVSFGVLDPRPYHSNGISFKYVGTENIEDRDLSEIFGRQNRYIRGKNLIQKDSRLILYELKNEWNLNYQRQANQIGVRYGIYKILPEEAENTPTLMRDETYSIGIKWNYCDGTSSAVFHIPGRAPTDYDKELIPAEENCTDCDRPRWQVKNTANREIVYCDEPYGVSAQSAITPTQSESKRTILYGGVEYEKIEKSEVTDCCGDLCDPKGPCAPEGCGCDGSCGECSGGCSGGCDDTTSTDTNCVEGDSGSVCYGCESGFSFDEAYNDYFADIFWVSNGERAFLQPVPVSALTSGLFHDATWHPNDTFRIIITDNDNSIIETIELEYNCVSEALTASSGDDLSASGGECPDGGCDGSTGESGSGMCQSPDCISCGDIIYGVECDDDERGEHFQPDVNGDPYRAVRVASDYAKGKNENNVLAAASANGGCDPQPIYDETGCFIVGYTRPLVAVGNMSYWESLETYPETVDCDGNFVFGNLAGKKIRHHKTPSELIEPHFISSQLGVPSPSDPANDIQSDTFIYTVGLMLDNIKEPENLPKPLCPNNPYSIVYQKRDEKNSSILGKGLFTGTFKGEVDGREVLVPNNGVNSLEKFDGSIFLDSQANIGADDINIKKHRGGWHADVAAYNFHSPEFHFSPSRNLEVVNPKAHVIWELYGEGYRYGQYAKGQDEGREWSIGRENQRGTRQWVNLNHYTCIKGSNVPNDCCNDLRVDSMQNTWWDGRGGPPLEIDLTYDFKGQSINIDYKISFYKNGSLTAEIVDNYQKSAQEPFLDLSQLFSIEFAGVLSEKDLITTVLSFEGTRGECRFSGIIRMETEYYEGKVAPIGYKTEEHLKSYFHSPDCNVDDPIVCGDQLRCIKGISHAPSDSVIKKGDEFTYPLLNLYREESVYLEFEGLDKLKLGEDTSAIDPFISSQTLKQSQQRGQGSCTSGRFYNGFPDDPCRDGAYPLELDPANERTSDGSFLGDTMTHDCPIYRAGGWYGSLKKENQKQYGRLESAPYITLYQGTSEELLCGRAEISGVGDTWISQYSFIRHSLVSDKVGGTTQQRNDNSAERVILCNFKCNDTPSSRDRGDQRNFVRLRSFPDTNSREPDDENGSDPWDGESEFRGLTGRDSYRPNLLKTQVTFWVESSINTTKRQRGSYDNCEIAYPELGSWELDSDFPFGGVWKESLLNCHYVDMKEASGFKKFARTILALIANIATLTLTKDSICNGLNKLFNFDQCAPRCYGSSDGRSDQRNENCVVDLGTIKGNPNNFCKYSFDYSLGNEIEIFYGQPVNYDTCICDDLDSKIRYSDTQNPDSQIDAYRNFRVNAYSELGAEYGTLKNFFNIGNNLYAHTTDMILNLRSDYQQLQTTEGEAILLGRQGFLQRASAIQAGLPEGYGGTLDPHAAITTAFGYFFVDREARKIFRFSGGGLEEISNYGLRNFFKEELYIKLLDYFPEYDCVDEGGVGYKFGYDHRFNRLLFTKEDYTPKTELFDFEYLGGEFFSARKKGTKNTNKNTTKVKVGDPDYFCNRSYTLSYDVIKTRWISFHSYIPRGYVYDRNHMFTWVDQSLWKHGDIKGSYQTYYGKYYPHEIEMITYADNQMYQQYSNTELETEARRWVNCQYVENIEQTFNKALIYNSNQSSGEVELVRSNPNNQLESLKQANSKVRLERTEKRWKINDFQNRVIDPSVPLFECNCSEPSVLDVVNDGNIKNEVNQTNSNNFNDDYLGIRLKLDNPEDNNLELITKWVLNWSNKQQ